MLHLERLENRDCPSTLDLSTYSIPVNVLLTSSDGMGYSGSYSGGAAGTFSGVNLIRGNHGTLEIDDSTGPTHTYGLTASSFTEGGGIPSLSYAQFASLTLDASSGVNTINVQQTRSGTSVIVHGGGSSKLIAPNVANAWELTGYQAGTVVGAVGSSITFDAVPNLQGGSAADRFVLDAAASGFDGGSRHQITV